MDNRNHHEISDVGNAANTEYLPTKCRITKPPPPKPATNPLQFVKVAPCPLFQKAHEQIKKVEEIKKERKEVKEEAEDWQQNLDNWKSCRRKRQEHIIERVVEVKKMELEDHDKGKRKSKTFNEMMAERSKGRHKFNIPIYDDDSNDLSDYGIGSSSSKTNSIKDVDTDDSCSVLDEKENSNSYDSPSNKDTSSASNQSQSEDELKHSDEMKSSSKQAATKVSSFTSKFEKQEEQYTYEGAIQDYRTRIRSKVHVDESIFTKHQDVSKSREFSEAQTALPKGEIVKRKELFECEKTVEIRNYESPTTRRLSEDFVNSQSIKQRLQSLEKCTDQTLTNNESDVKCLQNDDTKNNKSRPVQKINSISNLLDKSNLQSTLEYNLNKKGNHQVEWCSSPEAETYMDNLKTFGRDLDTLYNKTNGLDNDYPASISSTELTTISDREDSGIHTTDVSCSVSQADEPVEDIVEKHEEEREKRDDLIPAAEIEPTQEESNAVPVVTVPNKTHVDCGIESTIQLLEALRRDSAQNLENPPSPPKIEPPVKKPVPAPRIYENIALDFLAPPTLKEPPKVKPPPPPPPADTGELKRLNSTKRIKKEIHLKRSSFLGLNEPTDEQLYPEVNVDKPPDINAFLQKESKLKKLSDDNKMLGNLSKVESHDSGLDIDRGRLSSDTWCTNSTTPSPERQDSEPTNSITSEEDEIMKKEREIIEMVEKEEKSRDIVEFLPPIKETPRPVQRATNTNPHPSVEPFLGSDSFNSPYFPKEPDYLEDQDSEVLKVEQELRQLEREELKRQRENILFQESRAKARLNNRHSMENIFDSYPPYQDGLNYRKSMPELQNVPLDYRKSLPEVPSYQTGDVDVTYRKSMPDIQHLGYKNNLEHLEHRQSMPDIQKSAFKRPSIMPGEPIRPKGHKDRYMMMKPSVSADTVISTNKPRQLSRTSLHALSAVPKNRHLSVDNWIQPRVNHEKNLNKHWLIQEAELRRLSEQKPMRNRPQAIRQEKHLPDSIIHTLTQRALNKSDFLDRNQVRSPPKEHPYLGHALPMPYQPQVALEQSQQERILSVSGKKKCSNCNKELGRGAAMIIESLCLFYHMECFICCVCRMQLGDGRMGTDVRVRNHKLHCHNCYSSDDGIKFSCV